MMAPDRIGETIESFGQRYVVVDETAFAYKTRRVIDVHNGDLVLGHNARSFKKGDVL